MNKSNTWQGFWKMCTVPQSNDLYKMERLWFLHFLFCAGANERVYTTQSDEGPYKVTRLTFQNVELSESGNYTCSVGTNSVTREVLVASKLQHVHTVVCILWEVKHEPHFHTYIICNARYVKVVKELWIKLCIMLAFLTSKLSKNVFSLL